MFWSWMTLQRWDLRDNPVVRFAPRSVHRARRYAKDQHNALRSGPARPLKSPAVDDHADVLRQWVRLLAALPSHVKDAVWDRRTAVVTVRQLNEQISAAVDEQDGVVSRSRRLKHAAHAAPRAALV